jgi:alkylated DNA repair dioxygenase AlkB
MQQLSLGSQNELFTARQELPNGLVYLPEFISREEEKSLLSAFTELPFRDARYKTHTAKRRVVRFGSEYLVEQDEESDFPRVEFPPFLAALRNKVAQWLELPADHLEHGLVTEYRPGTPIGWHRDAPHFEVIAGVSLAGSCRMRFRPLESRSRADIQTMALEPRSVYVMRNEIRWGWQHSIGPMKALRYSITMRTLRDGSAGRFATALPPAGAPS